MNKQSLRHIKREATANALADAAFALALEQGLDGFVVEDVVRRAGYSRRTFANHFSCKEEAVATAAVIFKGADEVKSWIEGLNEDTSPLDCLYQLMKMQLTTEHFQKLRKLVSLSKQHPSLEPYILSALHGLQLSAQELLNELSRGRYPEGYTHLLTGAVYGAVLPLLDGSLNVRLPDQSAANPQGAVTVTFDHYLDTMFSYLRSGF
ncbi:TetR/AcrR family transcriptional regulator [Paenibacillus mendelii]|uniref:TetR/AcrR family transcriptional regulator n=1 Tax=Paenibacillus mendelii TaxID=206163 RepID=A0ABV6JPJ4_9BACL|nr:TetR/AcrR family transcriptional regulator [Paenibacillus mendelii]MCQ6562258.1 TetR/AcrR family transcriptional regulator [Paenibacillus mendelii]